MIRFFRRCFCTHGVEFPKRFWNLKLKTTGDPDKKIIRDKWEMYIRLNGSGSFISAQISKKSVGADTTDSNKYIVIRLRLDDQIIVQQSFKTTRKMGLTQNNPYGITVLEGESSGDEESKKEIDTLTIGFAEPLYFRHNLFLDLWVTDDAVEKIFTSVISGFSGTMASGFDGEGGGGGGGEPMFP